MVAAAILAVGGWIWALTNVGMPDALWLLTVLLSVTAIVLALYAIISDRTSAGRHR